MKKLLIIVTLISAAVASIAVAFAVRAERDRSRAEQNHYQRYIEWTDQRGRLVSQASELRYTAAELRRVARADSANLSRAQINLLQARRTIRDLV